MARKCPRCLQAFTKEALSTRDGYAQVVDESRALAIRSILCDPAREVYPDVHIGNFYAWPINRLPRPEGRWPAYGYEQSGMNVTMPRVYLNAGSGGAGRDQERMNWNAFYCCLEGFSPAASALREGELLIPWVHVWIGGRYPSFVMRGRKLPEPDEAGFIAVYANGTGRFERMLTWNAGNCCGYAMRNNVDDVGFVRTLLDDLASAAKIDQDRVYATGMSNGAMISYRLASELSDRIAAIAPVAGPMGTETCIPKRPAPVMHFHGTDDEFAAFQGGPGPKSISQTDFYSVEHSIEAWVKANGCPAKPTITKEPDRADDGMTVTRKTYGPGRTGSEVVLLVIESGGHTWPGREPRIGRLGKSTRDISANDLMWEFFQRRPRSSRNQ